MCLNFCQTTITLLLSSPLQNTCMHSFHPSTSVYDFIKILSPAVVPAARGTAPRKTALFVYKVTQPSPQCGGMTKIH